MQGNGKVEASGSQKTQDTAVGEGGWNTVEAVYTLHFTVCMYATRGRHLHTHGVPSTV